MKALSWPLRPDSFRFRPPFTAIGEEQRWALCAAFGRFEPPLPNLDKAEAVNTAIRMGLAPRIASRTGDEALEEILGLRASGPLVAARRAAGASTARAELLAEAALSESQRLDIPMLLLKGAALNHANFCTFGSRPMADVDVLVPEHRGLSLMDALEQRGLRRASGAANGHHYPALLGPLGTLEVHYRVRGPVTAEGEWWRLADALADAASGSEEEAGNTPAVEFLAAHAFAHTLDQHSFDAGSQRPLTLFGDVLDLFPEASPTQEVKQLIEVWLRNSVSARELHAAWRTAECLRRGTLPQPKTDADRLLRHMIEGTFSGAYRHSLRFRRLRRRVRDALTQGLLRNFLERRIRRH